MTSLPRICFALFMSLPSLQAATPLKPRRLAQTPVRRPLSARQVAQRVLPSVVYIEMEASAGKPPCYGSGFFVTRTEILTNKHVVTCSDSRRGSVRLAGGRRSFPATTILAWPDLDLALVEAEGLSAPPLQLASGQVSVGDDIYVAGNPAGLEGTFTRGIVSGVRSREGLLQIDAPVSRGSSGGPVVDSYGRVVGITISSITEGQNLNFAIPSASLVTPIERMRRMMAQQRSKRAGGPSAAGRAEAPAAPPTPAGPALRAWERNPDWGAFVSPVVGDTAVTEELRALLDSGLSPNTPDRYGRAALHLSALLGQADLARFLLARGVAVDARDRRGRTPLIMAFSPPESAPPVGIYAPQGDIWTGSPCAAARAGGLGSEWGVQWARWYSALEVRRQLIKLLVDAGADPAAADGNGRTAFDRAASGGVTGLEDVLRGGKNSGAAPACRLTGGRRPALLGLSPGMTREEVSKRLRGLTLPPPDRCGLSYAEVAADGPVALPPEFRGVRFLRLAFLDGRLTYVHVAYEPESQAKGFDEYLATVSAALGITGRWRRATHPPAHDDPHSISCDGVTAVAGRLKLSRSEMPYAELHDEEALRALVRRWGELQGQPPETRIVKP